MQNDQQDGPRCRCRTALRRSTGRSTAPQTATAVGETRLVGADAMDTSPAPQTAAEPRTVMGDVLRVPSMRSTHRGVTMPVSIKNEHDADETVLVVLTNAPDKLLQVCVAVRGAETRAARVLRAVQCALRASPHVVAAHNTQHHDDNSSLTTLSIMLCCLRGATLVSCSVATPSSSESQQPPLNLIRQLVKNIVHTAFPAQPAVEVSNMALAAAAKPRDLCKTLPGTIAAATSTVVTQCSVASRALHSKLVAFATDVCSVHNTRGDHIEFDGSKGLEEHVKPTDAGSIGAENDTNDIEKEMHCSSPRESCSPKPTSVSRSLSPVEAYDDFMIVSAPGSSYIGSEGDSGVKSHDVGNTSCQQEHEAGSSTGAWSTTNHDDTDDDRDAILPPGQDVASFLAEHSDGLPITGELEPLQPSSPNRSPSLISTGLGDSNELISDPSVSMRCKQYSHKQNQSVPDMWTEPQFLSIPNTEEKECTIAVAAEPCEATLYKTSHSNVDSTNGLVNDSDKRENVLLEANAGPTVEEFHILTFWTPFTFIATTPWALMSTICLCGLVVYDIMSLYSGRPSWIAGTKSPIPIWLIPRAFRDRASALFHGYNRATLRSGSNMARMVGLSKNNELPPSKDAIALAFQSIGRDLKVLANNVYDKAAPVASDIGTKLEKTSNLAAGWYSKEVLAGQSHFERLRYITETAKESGKHLLSSFYEKATPISCEIESTLEMSSTAAADWYSKDVLGGQSHFERLRNLVETTKDSGKFLASTVYEKVSPIMSEIGSTMERSSHAAAEWYSREVLAGEGHFERLKNVAGAMMESGGNLMNQLSTYTHQFREQSKGSENFLWDAMKGCGNTFISTKDSIVDYLKQVGSSTLGSGILPHSSKVNGPLGHLLAWIEKNR